MSSFNSLIRALAAAAFIGALPAAALNFTDLSAGNDEGMAPAGQRVTTSGGFIGPWQAVTGSTTLSRHASVAWHGRLYLIGGLDGSGAASPYLERRVIHGDGTLDPWQTDLALPSGRYDAAALVYNGFFYVIGGRNGAGADLNEIRVGKINTADGSVGSMTLAGVLPAPVSGAAAVARGGRLYLIGGVSNGSYPTAIQSAVCNADGTLSAWSPVGYLPGPRSRIAAAVWQDRLYVTGGTYNDGADHDLADLLVAPFQADGTLGAWLAAPPFTTARYGHASFIRDGYLYVAGGARHSGAELADVQLALLGENGRPAAWDSGRNLPSARAGHAVAVLNRNVYLTGGTSGVTPLSDTQWGVIAPQGGEGAWLPQLSSLPTGFSGGHAAIAYGGTLYVTGIIGSNSVVEMSRFYSDGTVGAWTTTTAYPVARSWHAIAAWQGHLYMAGGQDNSGNNLNDVRYAAINSDGTLGTWISTTSLPAARYSHGLVAANGTLFIVGGTGNGGTVEPTVGAAPINPDGSLGGWNFSLNPLNAGQCAAAVTDGRIAVLDRTNVGAISIATLNGGTVGVWQQHAATDAGQLAAQDGYLYALGGLISPSYAGADKVIVARATDYNGQPAAPLSQGRVNFATAVWNGSLYILGGTCSVAGCDQSVQRAVVHAGRRGRAGSWTALASLPATRSNAAGAVWNNRLYLLGGYGGTTPAYLNSVITAAVNPDDTLGAWTTTASFASTRSGAGAAAWNGWLYLAGGQVNNTIFRADLQRAPINPDGTLGAWSSAGALPTGRAYLGVAVHKGNLYVTGGRSSSGQLTDVLLYPINPDGSLGAMSTLTPLPVKRQEHAAVAYNGTLYVAGGFNNTNQELNDLRTAPINPDGTIGAWSAGPPLPVAVDSHAMVADNGMLYVLGGEDVAGTPRTAVQAASLAWYGQAGDWAASSDFATPRFGHVALAAGGNLYLLGGTDDVGALSASVQRAPLLIPKAAGAYSALLDLGAVQNVDSFRFFAVGAGARNLSYSAVPSTGLFSAFTAVPAAASNTPYAGGLGGCGRWLAIRFELDDGAVNLFDSDSIADPNSGPASLTSMTVNVSAPSYPVSPGNGLRVGKSGADPSLTWSAAAGASSYNVRRCDGGACTPALYLAAPSATAYVDTASANTSFYTVEAVNSCGVTP